MKKFQGTMKDAITKKVLITFLFDFKCETFITETVYKTA